MFSVFGRLLIFIFDSDSIYSFLIAAISPILALVPLFMYTLVFARLCEND